MASPDKGPGAFRTIGELSLELGVAQHILRYWETKFPQLKPLQRAGNRRYYRPADVDLARKIHRLLSQDGYTVRGVQKLLRGTESNAAGDSSAAEPAPAATARAAPPQRSHGDSGVDLFRLVALRNRLASALDS
ncbi:MAG: MerR family transcriptional regulator [Sphingomicrobium sp.]